jgi:hypothetical protein
MHSQQCIMFNSDLENFTFYLYILLYFKLTVQKNHDSKVISIVQHSMCAKCLTFKVIFTVLNDVLTLLLSYSLQ